MSHVADHVIISSTYSFRFAFEALDGLIRESLKKKRACSRKELFATHFRTSGLGKQLFEVSASDLRRG